MLKKNISLELIISLYEQHRNIAVVAESLNCGTGNISKRLKKAGVIIQRDYSIRRESIRLKLSIDESYFSVINTEDKAYFLGLMFADGSVSKNSFYIKLKDEDVLLLFKLAMKAETSVKYRDGFYILLVSRTSMCNDLILLGCIPNKTHTMLFPDIRKDLLKHFIRGFYDGDGSLILNVNRSHNSLNFTSGCLEFLEQLRVKLQSIALTNGGISKEKHHNVWHLRYGGRQVHIILKWLYKDSKFYLQRKYNKFLLSN